MKLIILFLSSFVSCASFSQVSNGNFEKGSDPDLSYWEWTCGAKSFKGAPAGGGNWCLQVSGGNTQGCFPGYSYQKIPSITNDQAFILSGWVFAQTSPRVGIYFGKISNGIITIQEGDTTSSTSWIKLSVQSSFKLSAGDTAAVVLNGGLLGGPAQGYGYFDLINLQQVSGIYSMEQKQSLKVFPDPFSLQTIIQTETVFRDATLILYNSFGRIIKKVNHISGQTFTLHRDNLPNGIYFLHMTQDNKAFKTAKILIAG
jgi:hypothetical protein